MSIEEKVRYLLRAARRAEGEGDDRVAQVLRRMAEDSVPLRTVGALTESRLR